MGRAGPGSKVPEALTAEWLWKHAGMSYGKMAIELDSYMEIMQREANAMKFRRPLRKPHGFERGPCVRCGVQYGRDQLNDAFKCLDCEKVERLNAPRNNPWREHDERAAAARELCRAEYARRH